MCEARRMGHLEAEDGFCDSWLLYISIFLPVDNIKVLWKI